MSCILNEIQTNVFGVFTSTDGYTSGGHRTLHGRVRERERSGGG